MSRVCSLEGCDRPARTRGMCGTHYTRVLRFGDPLAHIPVRGYGQKRCQVRGCRRRHQGQGLCNAHHLRVWRTGELDLDRPVLRRRKPRKPARPWPAYALLAARPDLTPGALADLLGTPRIATGRWQTWHLTTRQADEYALRLGWHPIEVWPAWGCTSVVHTARAS